MRATTNQAKRGFYIEVGCPGCGGALELQENFFVLQCDYCGSTLRVVMPDLPPVYVVRSAVRQREIRFKIDRFQKEHDSPLTDSDIQYKFFYYPYWKVDSIVLKTRNRISIVHSGGGNKHDPPVEIESRHTDISLSPHTVTFPAGFNLPGIPCSLGLRTEYLRVETFSEENIEDRFVALPVVLNVEEAVKRARNSVESVGRIEAADFGKNRTEMYRPSGSLIYFPYCIAESYSPGGFGRWIVDCITGRVIDYMSDPADPEQVVIPEQTTMSFGQIAVGFHRCSNCGIDLSREQSFLYICGNCRQLTSLEPCDLVSPDICTAGFGNEDDMMIPFWSLNITEEIGERLRSFWGGLHYSDRLVIPAIRLGNFEATYRLTRRISSAMMEMNMQSLARTDGRFQPVAIGPREALVMAEVIVAREIANVSSSLEAPDLGASLTGLSLFFVPFHYEHYFCVDSVLGAVTFEKSALQR